MSKIRKLERLKVRKKHEIVSDIETPRRDIWKSEIHISELENEKDKSEIIARIVKRHEGKFKKKREGIFKKLIRRLRRK